MEVVHLDISAKANRTLSVEEKPTSHLSYQRSKPLLEYACPIYGAHCFYRMLIN